MNPYESPAVDGQPERDGIRVAIRDWLNRKAQPLCDLYLAALHLTYSLDLPGRVRLVSHAVREIRNSLPTYVAGATGQQVRYAELVQSVRQAWIEGKLPAVSDPDGGAIEVPRRVIERLVELMTEHVAGGESAMESAAQLFAAADRSGITDAATLRGLAKRWRNETEWSVKLAHDPRKAVVLPGDDELKIRFELFEDHLYGLSGPYFDVLEELDAILEQANS